MTSNLIFTKLFTQKGMFKKKTCFLQIKIFLAVQRQNLQQKASGAQPEFGMGMVPNQKMAQLILNKILFFTFTFIYLIFYKRLFFYFQQQFIFEQYRFRKYFSGIISDKYLSHTLYVNLLYSLQMQQIHITFSLIIDCASIWRF